MSINQHLFTVEEALVRLGQTREVGCLIAFNLHESVHLFTNDGFVIHAVSGKREGEPMIEAALQLENASYTWIAGAAPPSKSMAVNIQAYALKHAIKRDTNIAETSKMPVKLETKEVREVKEKEKKVTPDYYLLPTEHPAASIKLTRLTSIVGRDEACDLVIPNGQISRRHCLLDITARGLFVRDLDSTNGTFVNGHFIKEGYVNAGDRLTLGTYALTVQKETPSGKPPVNKVLKLGAGVGNTSGG
jgi:hypothetical protein